MTTKTLTIGGKPCLLPGETLANARHNATPLDFWQRANSYTCPIGKEPGTAWLLLKRSDLNALSANAYHQLVWTDDTRTLTIPSLRIVRDICLDRAIAGDVKAARLVELHDKRRQLKLSSINAQYNIRIPAPSATSGTGLYYTDSLNGGSAWTWQTMLDDIWGDLPSALSGTAPTLPYTPNGTPEGWRFIGVSAWDALHTVLAKIDVTTRYDPIEDDFSYIRLGTTQSGLSASLTDLENWRIYDFDPGQNYQHDMPATVRVFFRRRELYHGIEKDTPDSDNWELAPTISKDYTTGISGATSGTVMAVWDDLPALVDDSGTNTNSAALQARADEIGANVANRLDVSESRSRRIYGRLVTDVLPGSEVSSVVWRDYGDNTGLVSEIILRPPADKCRSTNCMAEQMEGFDWGANPYPLWPRLGQPVQVDDGVSTTGDDVAANGDGLIPGFVRRWASGSFSTLDACWIRPVDLEGGASPSEANVVALRQKDTLVGRLSGSDTSGGDTRPTYLVRKGVETESTVMWGIATANWSNSSPCPSVTINPVDDCSGANPDTSMTLTILLPRTAEQDPNVVLNDVIGYRSAAGAEKVCVTDYLDDKIGAVKLWTGAVADIPPGWAIMDGSANGSGSGIDMTNRFVRGSSVAGQFGGADQHDHEFALQLADHIISAGQLSHTHGLTDLNIQDHTVDDLRHSHPLIADTAYSLSTGATSVENWAECVGYPDALPPGLSSRDDFVAECQVSPEWGPLTHDTSGGIVDPGGPGPITLTHPPDAGFTTVEENIPEYTTLIFIERIDNSA